MEKLKGLIEAAKLAKIAGTSIHNIRSYNTYVDCEFFFDHVIELDDSYVNFCKINDMNRPRYELLLEINRQLESAYFMPTTASIIDDGTDEWFYEQIPKGERITNLSTYQLQMLWDNLADVNRAANDIIVDENIVTGNNEFFKKISYFNTLKRETVDSVFEEHVRRLSGLYVVYADVDKALELGRIRYTGTHFTFTGLQSFLPCPDETPHILTAVLTCMGDGDDVIDSKMKLLPHPSSIRQTIKTMLNQININPSYYKIDTSELVAHLERICKRLQ